ncbi:DNA ligase 1-like [Diabrotica virgifera virgifera]|uniref:Cilia- and flagella-associated protein 251-like n=1 Tax=Diabrotica virgifera virgifera TaxID=50390 RepID=A0ABM5L5H7_DIAVI|nr:DNA ligase 1-like [Diabrotica virgifera virgifera]
MDSTKTKKRILKHEDDYRQGNKDDEKTKKNENGEERPQDGRLEEEEQRRFEEEMLDWHSRQPKMNRSGTQKHSTLVGDDVLKEITRAEEDKEEGDTGEEDPLVERVEVEEIEAEGEKERQRNTQWQDIEESILSALLFDEEDREEMKQNKKRKGDSLEINEKFKKEKREESVKYSEETENERIQRKLKEVLHILNAKGSIEGEEKAKARKLIGEITAIQNKTSQNQNQTTQGEEEDIKCEQFKYIKRNGKKKKFTKKRNGNRGVLKNLQETIEKKECLILTRNNIKEGGVESVIRTIREEVYEIIEGCNEGNVEYIENVKKAPWPVKEGNGIRM